MTEALGLLKDGKAEALVAAKMDPLARSVLQTSDVLETARNQRCSVPFLDLGMDIATLYGKAMAQMLAVFAALDREMIDSTRDAPLLPRREATGSAAHAPPAMPSSPRS